MTKTNSTRQTRGNLTIEFSDCPHTPVMVYLGNPDSPTASACYWTAFDLECLTDDNCENVPLTRRQVEWLARYEESASDWYDTHRDPDA